MTTRQNKNDHKRQHRKAFAYGRDRQTTPQDQRSPYPKPSDAGRDNPLTLTDYTYRTIDLSLNPIDPDPSLMTATIAKMIQDAQDHINQQIVSTLIYGQSPIISNWRASNRDMLEDERSPLKREMTVGEIIGYRCWRLEHGLLRSVYVHDWWKPGTILEGRELEDWDQRGIHAWKASDSKEFFGYVRGYLNNRQDNIWGDDYRSRPCIVTGSVYLWGDVVEHEYGYRAEYASIRSLDWIYPTAKMMGREGKTLFELRERYGVR